MVIEFIIFILQVVNIVNTLFCGNKQIGYRLLYSETCKRRYSFIVTMHRTIGLAVGR